MRAARYYGKEDIRIEDDVAKAKCGAGQVRVRLSPFVERYKMLNVNIGRAGVRRHLWYRFA